MACTHTSYCCSVTMSVHIQVDNAFMQLCKRHPRGGWGNDLMLLHGGSYISSIDSPVVQVCQILDVGQHIAAVVSCSSNGVAGQIDQPKLLELPQVHDIVKGGNAVATYDITQASMR